MYPVDSIRLATCVAYFLLLFGKANTQLLRSGDVGVSRCVMQGKLDSTPVQLYVFLSACVTAGQPSTMHVSGIFFLNNLKPIVDSIQLMQVSMAKAWAQGKKALVLRSPHTGKQWALSLQLAEPWKTTVRRRIPGRLSASLSLPSLDQQHLEFHLVARPGFHTFCSFLPGALQPPQWPGQPAPQTAPWGVKRCGWREEADEDSARDATSAPPPPTYMIVSPFFGISPANYVSLLELHIRYHERLGVDRYIAYVEDGASILSADPRVQALMAAGKLRIVEWLEVPHYFANTTYDTMRHPYASQLLTYNHALVALWHEDAVAVVSDLDEFLMTPNKTTMRQLLRDHRRDDSRVVTVQIPRRVGYCTGCGALTKVGASAGSQKDQLNKDLLQKAHPLERSLWLNATAAASIIAAGAAAMGWNPAVPPAHPLALYGMTATDVEPKSILEVRHVAFMNPHRAHTLPGKRNRTVARQDAYWLHVRSQLTLRLPKGFFVNPAAVSRSFMWALDDLGERAASGG